jgi:hypothetical protein
MMKTDKLKTSLKAHQKKGLYYLVDENDRIKVYRPWLGDLFAPLYDGIMKRSVFPKKFNASFNKHIQYLKQELRMYTTKKCSNWQQEAAM